MPPALAWAIFGPPIELSVPEFSYMQRMRRAVLPQVLRKVVPALVNQIIIIVKDTSLVVVIGMFDLLGAAEMAVRNVAWAGGT